MKPILFALLAGLLLSCTPDDNGKTTEAVPVTDQDLVALARNPDGFFWYRNRVDIRPSASASAHTAYFRVRFNAKAHAVLGADGTLPAGAVFPEGSVVVKELYQQPDGAEVLIAVMLKKGGDPNSADGWLWGEYRSNGDVYVPVASGPTVCAPCHRTNARDGVRVFDAVD